MAINGNHMSEGACYQCRDARDMALVSLLRTAHQLFSSASIIRELPRLVQLRDQRFPIEEVHPFFQSLDPPFLDAFRIATSFENLFKAELLDYGYVVHKIDQRTNAKKFETLGKQQILRPIRVSEIRKVEQSTWRRRGEFKIASLNHETLTLGSLISAQGSYKRTLRLNQSVIEALSYVRKQRNTVHFVVNDMGRFNNHVVDWYLDLRATINRRLLPRYTKIISRYEHLKSSAAFRLDEI